MYICTPDFGTLLFLFFREPNKNGRNKVYEVVSEISDKVQGTSSAQQGGIRFSVWILFITSSPPCNLEMVMILPPILY